MQQFSMDNFIKSTTPSATNGVVGNSDLNKNTQIHDNSLKQDTFELSNEKKTQENAKKKNSLKEKILATAGIGTTIATVAFLIYKNKISKLQTLPKHIDFVQAKTAQEAIEFGKNVLKIEEYECFNAKDVDVLNWINEGIVNISNMHKGRLRIPRKVRYENLAGNVMACVNVAKDNPNYGRLTINSKMLGDIDAFIDNNLIKFHEKLLSQGGIKIDNLICPLSNEEIPKLYDLYTKKQATYNQKVQLLSYIQEEYNTYNAIKESSPYFINSLLRRGIITSDDMGGITFKELLEKPQTEQRKVLVDVLKKIKKDTGKTPAFAVRKVSPFTTIYHEFGHIQDMVLRTPAKGKYNDPSDYPKELVDWLNDANKMQIANCISAYATTGPGEFIAETFASCANGNTISPDVEKLYYELKGPKLPRTSK